MASFFQPLMKKLRMVMKFDPYGMLAMTNILILFIYNARRHKLSTIFLANVANLVRFVLEYFVKPLRTLSSIVFLINYLP